MSGGNKMKIKTRVLNTHERIMKNYALDDYSSFHEDNFRSFSDKLNVLYDFVNGINGNGLWIGSVDLGK